MDETVETFFLRDFHDPKSRKAVETPSVHIARGYERSIPLLYSKRPIVCISDWQCETATQRYFWTQAWSIMKEQVGPDVLERSLVIVAGDMASKNNSLRGTKSDAAPDYSWLRESFPYADILIVYGNHDYISPDHLQMKNELSGLLCLLPHGNSVGVPAEGTRYIHKDENTIASILATNSVPTRIAKKQAHTKKARESQKEPRQRSLQWRKDHPEQARLADSFHKIQALHQAISNNQEGGTSLESSPPICRIGAVHGIPASFTEGVQKIEREEYFRSLDAVCDSKVSPIDILITHFTPCLPGQEHLFRMGDDSKRLYEAFLQSQAYLHVCGHTHMDPPVSVVAENKVVVNTDRRVVVLVPPDGDRLSN